MGQALSVCRAGGSRLPLRVADVSFWFVLGSPLEHRKCPHANVDVHQSCQEMFQILPTYLPAMLYVSYNSTLSISPDTSTTNWHFVLGKVFDIDSFSQVVLWDRPNRGVGGKARGLRFSGTISDARHSTAIVLIVPLVSMEWVHCFPEISYLLL